MAKHRKKKSNQTFNARRMPYSSFGAWGVWVEREAHGVTVSLCIYEVSGGAPRWAAQQCKIICHRLNAVMEASRI